MYTGYVRWYGGDSVVDRWLPQVIEAAAAAAAKKV